MYLHSRVKQTHRKKKPSPFLFPLPELNGKVLASSHSQSPFIAWCCRNICMFLLCAARSLISSPESLTSLPCAQSSSPRCSQ